MTAAAREGYHAIMTKSFGPQIRGGESSFRLRLATAPGLHRRRHARRRRRAQLGRLPAVRRRASGRRPHHGRLRRGERRRAERAAACRRDARRRRSRCRSARSRARRQARRRPRTPSSSACWPAGSAWRATRLLAGLRKRSRRRGRGARRQRARVRRGRGVRGGASASRRRRLESPAAPAARRTAADRRQRDVRGGRDLRRLRVLRRLSDHAVDRDHAVPRPRDLEVRRRPCCRRRTRSPASAPWSARRSPAKKAMTATSGPGMSLKTEMLGLATIAELPLVCVNVQRGGPSTGMPTKSEQSDLFQAVFSAHGDVVRPVLAPIERGRHVRDDGRGVQHRRAVPDAGHPALRPGDRAAQGDRRSDRHRALHDRRPAEAERPRARALRALPDHRVGREPDQPSGHGGRQLPRVGHRAQRARRADGERRDARADEREAHPQAGAAQGRAATCSRSTATATRRSGSSAGAASPAWRSRRRSAWRAPKGIRSSCWCRGCSIRCRRRSTRTSSPRCGRAWSSSSRTRGSSTGSSACSWTCRAGPGQERRIARSGSNPIAPAEVLDRVRRMVTTLQRGRAPEPEPMAG